MTTNDDIDDLHKETAGPALVSTALDERQMNGYII
jgi:hypothetical protein